MVTNFFAASETGSSDALLERLRIATVGLYDVAGEIGRGGMAVVYIATDLRLGRKVAIKVMEPRLSFTPGMAERFLQEARIAARLQHHNIIVVHEVQQDEELIFFVMRLVEGGSLDELCRRVGQQSQLLPLDQAQWILWQTARALSYAHGEGIVHRDVKPANVLVTTKGEVVVTDFGIAKAADGEGLTKSGMAIGTPVYMSPEQFTGTDAVSGAADQYALGIAAYELLTGAPPFAGDLYRLIAAHGNTVPKDLRALRPDCPAPLADAVMRMLEKKPSDRWPSLDAVLPVLGAGLSIDGSSTRAELAAIATALQDARAASVAAWGAMAPTTPPWSSGTRKKLSTVPAAISVSPPSGQVVVGGQLDLRAVVTSDTGATVADAVVRWTSSDPSIATVTSEGAVTGIAAGAVTIRAQVSGAGGVTGVIQAAIDVTVAARQATRVRIVEAQETIECGEACLLTADVFDASGERIGDAEVQWSSNRPDVLHIDSRGTMMALSGGVATVTARVGDVHGTTRVEVREAPVGAVEMILRVDTIDVGGEMPIKLMVTDVSGLTRSSAGLVVVSDAPDVAYVRDEPLAVIARGAGRATLRVMTDDTVSGRRTGVQAPWTTVTVTVRAVVAPVAPRVPAPVAPVREPVVTTTPTREPIVATTPTREPIATTPPTPPVREPQVELAPRVAKPLTDAPPAPRSQGKLWGVGIGVAAVLAIVAVIGLRGGGDSAPLGPNDAIAPGAHGASPSQVAEESGATGDTRASLTDAVPGLADATGGGGVATSGSERSPGATTSEPPTVRGAPGSRSGTTTGSTSAPVSTGPSQTQTAPASPPRSGVQGGAQPGGNPTTVVPRSPTVPDSPRTVADRTDTRVSGSDSARVVSPPPTAPAEGAGPSESDMRSLARAFASRLERGEFRSGDAASFFSRTTSEHKASLLGTPRVVSRDGDALLVDADVQVERTLGSGAIDRRRGTARLVLRGRPGAATIESATMGALTRM